jgi:putative transposase
MADQTQYGSVRGAPCHPQTQGKIERWHQTLKNRILLENYYLPGDLEAKIDAFVDHYNHRRHHESLGNLGHPAAFNSPCNHAVNEHVSNPKRSKGRPRLERRVSSASGSLAARASFMIRPVSSTTQIAVSSNDTSNPAKYLIAAPFRWLWRFASDHVLTYR